MNYYSQICLVFKIRYSNDFSSPVLCREHNAVINKAAKPRNSTRLYNCREFCCANIVGYDIDLLERSYTMEELFVASLPRRLKLCPCFSSAKYGRTLSALFARAVALPRFKGTRAPNCIPPRLIHLRMSIYKRNTHRPVDFETRVRARIHGRASQRSSERRASILFIE